MDGSRPEEDDWFPDDQNPGGRESNKQAIMERMKGDMREPSECTLVVARYLGKMDCLRPKG